MLTIFTLPRAFNGHYDVIQRNALQSWLHLDPQPQIILFGNDAGVADAAVEMNLDWFSHVDRNEFGTPLIHTMFLTAQQKPPSRHDILAYVNADIILTQSFVEGVKLCMEFGQFLMIGQRWDCEIAERLDFSGDWETSLHLRVARGGALHAEYGIDYFVHTRNLWTQIPPFAIGRLSWDNWLVADVLARGLPVVNATDAVFIVHQNHDCSHYAMGLESPEVYRNRALMGDKLAGVKEATHKLVSRGGKR